jgi:hypothetical protein
MHRKLVYDKVLKKYFFYEEQSGGSSNRIQIGKAKKSPFSTKLSMLKAYYNNLKNSKKNQETSTTSDSEFFS